MASCFLWEAFSVSPPESNQSGPSVINITTSIQHETTPPASSSQLHLLRSVPIPVPTHTSHTNYCTPIPHSLLFRPQSYTSPSNRRSLTSVVTHFASSQAVHCSPVTLYVSIHLSLLSCPSILRSFITPNKAVEISAAALKTLFSSYYHPAVPLLLHD